MATSPGPVAHTGMLIRKPIAEVFAAFVSPETITRFWFTHSTGPLIDGATVTWTWGMYDISDTISVVQFEPERLVEFTWGGAEGRTTVTWTFTPVDGKGTFVDIRNAGFAGTGIEQANAAIDTAAGFSWVLAGAKAWLEHGLELGLVADRFPPELGEHTA